MRLRVLTAACLLGVTPAAALVAPSAPPDPRGVRPAIATAISRPVDLGADTPDATRARAFLARYGGGWDFSVDSRTGRPVLAEGSGIPLVPGRGNALRVGTGTPPAGLDGLDAAARGFLSGQADWLLPRRGTLELDRERSATRDAGRLASLYYRWVVDGVPVDGASVFVRINSGNVTQFGAPLVGEAPADVRPVLDAAQAIDVLMAYSGDAEAYRLERGPELLLQPEDVGEAIVYRLVWRAVYRVPGRVQSWEGRVDAREGRVVGFRDINAYGRVTGGVYPRSVFEQNEVPVAFPGTMIVVQGQTVTSDAAGRFDYPGGPASAGLDGRWFDTTCQGCSNPSAPSVSTALGTGDLDFGTGGADQVGNATSTPADRNTFYHLNQIRRLARAWLPGLSWLDTTVVSNVNLSYTCNAFYDGAVNFFRSGGGCNNSGEIADVIVHEWGHGLDLHTLGGDGATGEGTADVVALHLSHAAALGPGFEIDGTPLRDLDPNGPRGLLTTGNIGAQCSTDGDLGPLGYEVHCEGEIYGQTAWDLAQSFVAAYGPHTGWRLSERLFFNSLSDAGGYLPTSFSPIYTAYLFADDDDGNLSNGTPHAGLIHAAFDRHGIAGTLRPTTPECSPPPQPVLAVAPGCDGFDLSWDAVPGAGQYEIFRGELRLDQALFPVAAVPAGQTAYSDAEVAPGMDYWYVVATVDTAGCESTIENPVFARLPDRPLPSLVAVVVDDAPRGNRSGHADPGEEVDLVLTLRNVGPLPAVAVSGTLLSSVPGVEILDGQAAWGSIDPGAAATNADTLRLRTDPAQIACGDTIDLRLEALDGSGCSLTSSFTVDIGDAGVCDPTPPCTIPPSFSGIASAATGSTCAETLLGWQPAQSQCENAEITYNVYRAATADVVPSPGTRVATGVTTTAFVDTLLEPGATYYYVVRAYDSRSGEEDNSVIRSAMAGDLPDFSPPVFAGSLTAGQGAACGEVALSISPALESCSPPVSYEIYRATDPAFVPTPANRIGSSLSPSFTDIAPVPGAAFTYVVRAVDASGNASADSERVTVSAGVTDLVLTQTDFESSGDGWAVAPPNDATTGNWEWGAPELTAQQPGACSSGSRCWITGLTDFHPVGGNNDVDDGTTTLLSRRYGMSGAVDPVFRYSRWFTNDQGQNPGEDPFVVEVSSDNGGTWTALETVGAGTPLAWVPVEIPLPPEVTPTASMRVRFQASDLGGGSLVEAGIDDFSIVDIGQGCTGCPQTVPPVGTILATRVGDDVWLDWSADPAPGPRFVVYAVGGPDYSELVRIGSTTSHTFVHEGAAVSPASYAYRVTAVDACGRESASE